MYEAILRDWIWADGRGPELKNAHYRANGAGLVALDYLNPDHKSDVDVRHLIFRAAQVHMFTPEEVYNVIRDEISWGSLNQAAVVNLGKSAWFRSFNPHHLTQCNHYRVMFYDEYLDVICEGITAAN